GGLLGAFVTLFVPFTDDLRLGGLRGLFLFRDTRWHDGDQGEVELVEDLGLRRQLLHDVGHVEAVADGQTADVQLDVGRDQARQHRDADLTALHVQLAAVADAHRAAHELDGHGHLDRLVGAHGVEVHVHGLPAPLVHLDLPDDHAVHVASDVEVDQARVADLPERLVEGAHLDADGHVDLSVVHDSG